MAWENLIENWCNDKGRYGLTIPFLVGAERLNGEMTIGSLLQEIIDSDLMYFISSCGDLDEYVIGLQKPEYAYIDSLKKIGSLAINDSDLEDAQNIDELIAIMENEYQDFIDNGCYSKNYDTEEWADFDENDLAFIESVG